MSEITKEKLQPMLQVFNEDLGVFINNDQRHKLGRVLTVIDASVSDPEQRKAVKDLINSEWWGGNNRLLEGRMSNPHTDLRGICRALGFELYEPNNTQPDNAGSSGSEEVAAKRYAKLANKE